MQKIGFALGACVLFVASGCGGSSSGSKFEGQWKGTLFLVESSPQSCNFEDQLEVIYTVEDQQDEIVVTTSQGVELDGDQPSQDSFEVQLSSGSAQSPASLTLRFDEVRNGQANATYTDFQGSFNLETGVLDSCTGRWQGMVERN